MSERSGDLPAEGVHEDVRSEGDEGARTARSTPPVADDAQHGQTQAPAPPDDAGVPADPGGDEQGG
jgi:hypothetical protein